MMKLKKGYKQTEIGVIPEDWEIKELREVLTFGNGIDYKHLGKGNIPVYGTGGIMTYVNDFLYDGEAVGIGRKGTINKPVFLDGKFWTVDTLFYAHNFQNVLPQIIYYNFHLINWLDYNEASGVPSLSKTTIEKIRFPLPPSSTEQQAIAQVLTDIDQLIQSLKTLIEKKKAIKQGAMQELLTGKKRLRGFTGEWTTKSLEKVTENLVRGPFGGALKKEFFVKDGYKVYEQKNAIYKSISLGKYYIDENKFKELKRFELKSRDFIVSCSGTIGEIFQLSHKFKKGIINQALLKITLDNSIIDDDYFYYQFTSKPFQSKIIEDIQGGAMKNLVGMSVFKETEIEMPSNIKEQKAIAQILSDMDAEIGALEVQLQKTKNLKQGMMQELLTGKIRLVETVSQSVEEENKNSAMAAEPEVVYKTKS